MVLLLLLNPWFTGLGKRRSHLLQEGIQRAQGPIPVRPTGSAPEPSRPSQGSEVKGPAPASVALEP